MASILNTEYKGQWEARALSFLPSVVSLASENQCQKKNTWQTDIKGRSGYKKMTPDK